jgi:hypothetical protein
VLPFEVPEDVRNVVEDTLYNKLVEVGYFIGREEWEKRFPHDAAVSRYMREAMRDHDAARARGEQLVWRPKYSHYMQGPADFKWTPETAREMCQFIDDCYPHPWDEALRAQYDSLKSMNGVDMDNKPH